MMSPTCTEATEYRVSYRRKQEEIMREFRVTNRCERNALPFCVDESLVHGVA